MPPDHPPSLSINSVKAYYDAAAETWDETHGVARLSPRFAGEVRNTLKNLLSVNAPGSMALELGAGTGPYVDTTAPLVGRLLATDVSDGMLAVFARRVAQLGLTNVCLLRQDACDLSDIPASSVDIVYSIGLLETIPDLKQLFAETTRVLRPGGFVAGITSNGDCPWYKIRQKLEGGERHCRTGRLVTARILDEVLERSGFGASEITYWGTAPPALQNALVLSILGAVEIALAATPFRRHLGVLSFRSQKLHN
jgi:ubiquinone/menaquinone biosynthesis C-methylase UbiE